MEMGRRIIGTIAPCKSEIMTTPFLLGHLRFTAPLELLVFDCEMLQMDTPFCADIVVLKYIKKYKKL